MPYTSLPTLTDGSVLSASTLNAISANQEYLYGQSRRVNTPFISYRKFTELINADDVFWTITHRLRYFHFKANSQDTADSIKILYGPHTMIDVGPSGGVQGYFDLETLGGGVVVGTRYTIEVQIYREDGSTNMTIDYLFESDSTSI